MVVPRRIFILGAGASHEIFGLPLIENFVEEAVQKIECKIDLLNNEIHNTHKNTLKISPREEAFRLRKIVERVNHPFKDISGYVPFRLSQP